LVTRLVVAAELVPSCARVRPGAGCCHQNPPLFNRVGNCCLSVR
jgi:hypothetical protein